MSLAWSEKGEVVIEGIEDELKAKLNVKEHEFKVIKEDDEVQKLIKKKESENPKQTILPITYVEGSVYKFGDQEKLELKVIEEDLYVKQNGGYIPFDSFV